MANPERTDVAIIGGGYYGAFVAGEVKRHRPDLDVTIIEKENEPFTKASSTNQGQFHMGYMYSADKELARECVENTQRFINDFGEAIDNEVQSHYGVHRDSEISADQYAAFCEEVELPATRLRIPPAGLFGIAVDAAFATPEKTFNSARLQELFRRRMGQLGINLVTGFAVQELINVADGLSVEDAESRAIHADRVINATFADMNGLHERSSLPKITMQHDSFLHFVLSLPEEYRSTAATVIRGPYASLMPSSFRDGHVLASGKYRKVQSAKIDKPADDITQDQVAAIYRQALDDAVEYIPALASAKYKGYTLGTRAAHIDPETGGYTSKALVFKDFGGVPNYHAVLGGKVSCMFDVAEPIREIVAE